MRDLKLSKLPDRVPVKLTVSISPELNKRLQTYAALYKQTYGEEESVMELVPFMLEEFLNGDKGFKSAARENRSAQTATESSNRRRQATAESGPQ